MFLTLTHAVVILSGSHTTLSRLSTHVLQVLHLHWNVSTCHIPQPACADCEALLLPAFVIAFKDRSTANIKSICANAKTSLFFSSDIYTGLRKWFDWICLCQWHSQCQCQWHRFLWRSTRWLRSRASHLTVITVGILYLFILECEKERVCKSLSSPEVARCSPCSWTAGYHGLINEWICKF